MKICQSMKTEGVETRPRNGTKKTCIEVFFIGVCTPLNDEALEEFDKRILNSFFPYFFALFRKAKKSETFAAVKKTALYQLYPHMPYSCSSIEPRNGVMET